MRFPFIRSQKPADPAASAAPVRSRRAAKAASVAPPGLAPGDSAIEAARTAARRRLLGALALLVIGVVGFPILFETQPRPLPVDTPIEAGRPAGSSATVAPPRTARPLPVLPVDAGTESAADTAPASAPVHPPLAVPAPLPSASVPSAPVPASKPAAVAAAASPSPRPAPIGAPAAATPAAPKTVAEAAAPKAASAAVPAPGDAATGARFVVQVGAYAEATKLREARAKVEQLGLKTYTQVVESNAGSRTRVRVGPFASRAEADAVAAKVKRTGLPTAVIAL